MTFQSTAGWRLAGVLYNVKASVFKQFRLSINICLTDIGRKLVKSVQSSFDAIQHFVSGQRKSRTMLGKSLIQSNPTPFQQAFDFFQHFQPCQKTYSNGTNICLTQTNLKLLLI